MAKPVKTLELHYPMIQFFNNLTYHSFLTAYSGDYTLIFGEDTSESSMILWPTILTEIKAFTVCLWHKLYVQVKSGRLTMTLLRYFADDGNFTLIIKDFNEDGGPTLSLITWPRYDF